MEYNPKKQFVIITKISVKMLGKILNTFKERRTINDIFGYLILYSFLCIYLPIRITIL